MKGKVVKIGYCPTKRQIFNPTAPYEVNKEIISVINGFNDHVKIVYGVPNPAEVLLDTEETMERMLAKFREEKIDGLFIAECNFGSEILISRLAKALNIPVLLWGPRDEAPDANGLRARDSQCGSFAAGKVLRHYNVPFTYLIGSKIDCDYFRQGLVRFAAVCNVVRCFRQMRVLQVSTRPQPFMSVICNEGELLEKFGIETIPVPLDELLRGAETLRNNRDARVLELASFLETLIRAGKNVKNEAFILASIKVSLGDLIKNYGCNTATVQCWHAIHQITGVQPCIAHALLSDEGYPVACETDVCGAVSAALLQAASFDTNPQFFADLTVRHPEDDNAELLWHCGPFPYSLRNDTCKAVVNESYTLDGHVCGICEWELKQGDITTIRFDGDHGKYSLFIGEAVTTTGPYNRGTYVWIKTKDWNKWERKLVEGPYVHHVAGSYGHYGEILAEACKYFGGVTPDFAESGDEIMSRWG